MGLYQYVRHFRWSHPSPISGWPGFLRSAAWRALPRPPKRAISGALPRRATMGSGSVHRDGRVKRLGRSGLVVIGWLGRFGWSLPFLGGFRYGQGMILDNPNILAWWMEILITSWLMNMSYWHFYEPLENSWIGQVDSAGTMFDHFLGGEFHELICESWNNTTGTWEDDDITRPGCVRTSSQNLLRYYGQLWLLYHPDHYNGSYTSYTVQWLD